MSDIVLNITREQAALRILHARYLIDQANREIETVAKACMPDYHFLDYRVSMFWTCDHSPLGYCVFKIMETADRRLKETVCRYCGGPVERK